MGAISQDLSTARMAAAIGANWVSVFGALEPHTIHRTAWKVKSRTFICWSLN